MKSVTSQLVLLSAAFASAQFFSPDDEVYTECHDVCNGSLETIDQCGNSTVNALALEEHQSCMCGQAIPQLSECIHCAYDENEADEDITYWYTQKIIVSIQSTEICGPTASLFVDEVRSSLMDGAYDHLLTAFDIPTPTESRAGLPPLPTTPTPEPVPSTIRVTGTPTPTPSDEGGDEDDDVDNVSTGGAPMQSQGPFVLAMAGMALAAAI